MEVLKPTPQEDKAVKFTFNATLITTICVCFTLCFGFFKMEKTANETKSIAELEVRKKEAEAKIAGSKSPDYRPITLTDVSTHVLSTSYQSTIPSRYNVVLYSVNITSTLSLSGGTSGTIVMQVSPDNSTWTTISTTTNNTTGTLTLGLNLSNSQTTTLSAIIPPNYYYRLLPSGTSTTSIINGREAAF